MLTSLLSPFWVLQPPRSHCSPPAVGLAEELGAVRQRLAVAQEEVVALRRTQEEHMGELKQLRREKVGIGGGLWGRADLGRQCWF